MNYVTIENEDNLHSRRKIWPLMGENDSAAYELHLRMESRAISAGGAAVRAARKYVKIARVLT